MPDRHGGNPFFVAPFSNLYFLRTFASLKNRTNPCSYIQKNRQSCRPFIFIINYQQDASYIEAVSSVDPAEILYNLNGFTNQPMFAENNIAFLSRKRLRWQSFPESLATYQHSFDIVQRNIFAGNSFLTNLTCRTPVETNLTLKDIYCYSKAMYKLWVRDAFTAFSPEIFIRIHNGRIYSYPMKGTINASTPSADRLLINDPKETAEHATIVDLIRNDLSMVAEQVSVSRYRYIDKLQTNQGSILQTSSEIQGVLPDDYLTNLGNIPAFTSRFYHRSSEEKNNADYQGG